MNNWVSVKEIGFRQVNQFIASAVHYSAEHVETESFGFFEGDCGRHREFKPVNENLDQGRSLVRKCGLQSRTELLGTFDADAEHSHRFRNFRKARVLQVGAESYVTAALHFNFHESQRTVVEDHNLH